MKQFIQKLETMNACSDAVNWIISLPRNITPQQAWELCERGDWMLWLIGKTDRSQSFSGARKPIVRVALECARLAWKWMPEESRQCVELYERWVNGENVGVDELRQAQAAAHYAAADAAYAAADAADAAHYAAAAAHYAAADAAYAAHYAAADAADAAHYAAADAAAAAADAAAAHYAADTRIKTLKKCADIVRKYYPFIPEIQNVME